MNISILRLSPDEIIKYTNDIVRIYKNVWLTTYPNTELEISKEDLDVGLGSIEMLEEKWSKELLLDDRIVWVAQDNKDIIGFLVFRVGDIESELEYIYIEDEYQGHGVGRMLMDELLAVAGKSKRIILFGASYNQNAITFYKKYGFRLVDEELPAKVLPNGVEIPTMKMVKG